ncbi:hypothetical protein AFLA_011120 [Aspergillus flavus NRRL3357]|nr:hypothetical protein AFLA_011120 [Aspergillus flavus NRRL3357]
MKPTPAPASAPHCHKTLTGLIHRPGRTEIYDPSPDFGPRQPRLQVTLSRITLASSIASTTGPDSRSPSRTSFRNLSRSSPPDMAPRSHLPRPSVCLGCFAPNGRETLDRHAPGTSQLADTTRHAETFHGYVINMFSLSFLLLSSVFQPGATFIEHSSNLYR